MHKILYALLFSVPLFGGELVRISDIQSSLGDVELYHNGNCFSVAHEGSIRHVPSHNLDNVLRSLKPTDINKLSHLGYVRINRLSDGEFKLDFKGRVKGGGPVAAKIMYGLTKAFCWGFVGTATAAAVGTAVSTCGGGAVVGVGVKAAVGTAVKGAGSLVAASSAGTGAVALGAGSVGAGAGAAAATAVGTKAAGIAIVTAHASMASGAAHGLVVAKSSIGLIAAIEALSVAAGAWAATWPCP